MRSQRFIKWCCICQTHQSFGEEQKSLLKCVSTKTNHESITKNYQKIKKTKKIEIFVDEKRLGHKTTQSMKLQ